MTKPEWGPSGRAGGPLGTGSIHLESVERRMTASPGDLPASSSPSVRLSVRPFTRLALSFVSLSGSLSAQNDTESNSTSRQQAQNSPK